MSEIKLLHCPFCGGEFDLSNNGVKQGDKWLWSAECLDCGCFMDDENKENLIKRINTRKPMERILTRLEEEVALERMDKMEDRVGKRQTTGFCLGVNASIEIVKEEGGIE